MSLFHIFSQNLDSRLYVDLIYRATSQYASFNPSMKIELGDYGYLNKETGEFVIEGNLFKRFPELYDDKKFGEGTPEEHKSYFYSRSSENSESLHLDASIPSLVDCSFKAGWSFEKDRHAALVLIDPIFYELPYEGRLHSLLIRHEDLKKKAVVTKLYKCSSYANLLTNGKKGKAYFGFSADLPMPIAVPLTAGGGPDLSWKTFAESGAWNTGLYRAGHHPYTPIVTLRCIRSLSWASSFKGGHDPDVGVNGQAKEINLPIQTPPWGELTESGIDLDEELEDGDDDDE